MNGIEARAYRKLVDLAAETEETEAYAETNNKANVDNESNGSRNGVEST